MIYRKTGTALFCFVLFFLKTDISITQRNCFIYLLSTYYLASCLGTSFPPFLELGQPFLHLMRVFRFQL